MSVAAQIVEQVTAPKPTLVPDAPKDAPSVAGAESATQAPAKDTDSQLYIWAKKEKALVDKQRAFQQKQEEWKREQEELRKQIDSYKSKENLWKENPLKAAEEYGYDYGKLTELQLKGGELTPNDVLKKAEERIKELEGKLDNDKREQSERQKAQEEERQKQVVQDYKDNLKKFITDKKDEFKLSGLFDQEAEIIYDTIDTYYKKTCEFDDDGQLVKAGKIMEPAEAVDLVEKYLRKQLDEGISRVYPEFEEFMKAKKPDAKKPEDPWMGVRDHSKPAPSSTTLSNALNQAAPVAVPANTEAERIKRALAALDKKK